MSGSEDLPSDVVQRLRMMQVLMGNNPLRPTSLATGAGAEDRGSYSVGYVNLPYEREGFERALNMLNTRFALTDPASRVGGFLGLNALQDTGPYGFTAYAPQAGVTYGPITVMGGPQTMVPDARGAKSQTSYQYGGSVAVPLDGEERGRGTSAVLSATGTTGRSAPQYSVGLQTPFLGGLLGVDVSGDPRSRRAQGFAGWRREF